MSTRQAEEILEHTFKQLEKMVKDVRREKAGCSPHGPIRKVKTERRKGSDGPGTRKK